MGSFSQNSITGHFVQCVQYLLSRGKVRSGRQLALALEYTPQGLNEILKGKRNVPIELLKRAAEVYRLNLQFLFFGEGNMIKDDMSQSHLHTRVVISDVFQKERIVHVPVTAYAGYQDNLTEPVFVQELPSYFLPEHILRTGSYRSFDVSGESMEPTLYTGDKVIGAFVEPQYWEQGIKDNMIHVIVTYSEVLVKRVLNFIRTDKMLELHSDNSSMASCHLPIEEIREVWVVRLRITANLNKPNDHEILNEIKHTLASFKGPAPVI